MGETLEGPQNHIYLYEEIWIQKCPKQFKPKYYQRYVDDIFLLFDDSTQINKFEKFMNSRHKNIQFTKEIEKENSLSFLDIRIDRNVNNNFETSIYRKPTFSGVYLNFKSYTPEEYKRGLISCLLFRIYNLCSNWAIIHDEINEIKIILMNNRYPLDFINLCVKHFLEKCFIKKVPDNDKTETSSKEEFIITIPFLGNQSNIIKKKLKNIFSEFYPT